MTEQVTQTEYELLAAFRYALRQFLRFSEEAAKGIGMTPQQHQALLAIKGFPGRDRVTIGELAERLQLEPQKVAGLIRRLEDDGFLIVHRRKRRPRFRYQLSLGGDR